jgi:hypothetical protein
VANRDERQGVERDQGPDPVVGAGITLAGIFVMAAGGAWDAHYVFDVGALAAVGGAVTFVISVALSALRMRRSSPPPPLGEQGGPPG